MIPPEPESPQRSATRAAIDAAVRMQFDDSLEVVEGRCYNISIGGMFLDSDSLRPKGSLVRFELLLEDGISVRGLGEVVWAQDSAIPGRRAGLGLKFRFLEQRDRQAIFKLVSQHIKEKLAQRPPMAGEPPVPDTPLARQRRASMLGEGLPSQPSEPAFGPLSSTPLSSTPLSATVASPLPVASSAPPPADRPSRPVPIISAGAPIPPPKPLDKKNERPLEERTWQQPTMGGNGPRSSRPADPAWLDDKAGFAGEEGGPPAALPLRPGAKEDWDDRPLGPAPSLAGGGAEPHHYLEDTDPSHFEHRPKPKSAPWGLILGIAGALAVLALFWYFFWRSAPQRPPEVIRIGAAAQQGTAPPAQSSEPPPPPVRHNPPVAAPEPAAPEPAVSEPEPEPERPAPEPPASQPADEKPAAAEPPVTPAAKEFERVVGISHRKADGGVEIVIEGDGAIPESRTGRIRLEGREVLSLYGVAKRFDKKEIAVGDQWVKGLRIGYHAGGARGNEIRLVIDLASPSAKITRVRSQGKTLVVLIATD
jgi:hypothetical protein